MSPKATFSFATLRKRNIATRKRNSRGENVRRTLNNNSGCLIEFLLDKYHFCTRTSYVLIKFNHFVQVLYNLFSVVVYCLSQFCFRDFVNDRNWPYPQKWLICNHCFLTYSLATERFVQNVNLFKLINEVQSRQNRV